MADYPILAGRYTVATARGWTAMRWRVPVWACGVEGSDEMSRRAKDRTEYDEAVGVIQWLRARGIEMHSAGETVPAQRIAVVASQIADLFASPAEKGATE